MYYRKLYALLSAKPDLLRNEKLILERLSCLAGSLEILKTEAQENLLLIEKIASSSDRVNLQSNDISTNTIKHPISGQPRIISEISELTRELDCLIDNVIEQDESIKKVFWWFWRFYPLIIAKQESNPDLSLDFLLYPAHKILPDCPLHSYKSTVSALMGAMYPENSLKEEKPYLFLFTFSPIQEFIKASRKFLDFWAGSYLLHYLGVKIAWKIADRYGPDAIITPSLWGQEIIDALIFKTYPDFINTFQQYTNDDPQNRFQKKESDSLSTAGFPNVITALVPGAEAATELGTQLREYLVTTWSEIAYRVKDHIKQTTIEFLQNSDNKEKIQGILEELSQEPKIQDLNQQDLKKLTKGANGSCWEWNRLWQAQIENTWETYWTAIPLGNPQQASICNSKHQDYQSWKKAQNQVVPPYLARSLPTEVEETVYQYINVGTWWGALQARLGQSIQAVKNTRTWSIPTAPGERSTLSGQFSALHPQFNYRSEFKNGGGIPARSMRLFWRLIAEVYPGLFNGSEKLNAIELTKRMAWQYGGVAKDLGINIDQDGNTDYEQLIRFPNLSSIASARFTHDHPEIALQYWDNLNNLIEEKLPRKQNIFRRKTRDRPYQIPKVDRKIKEINRNNQQGQNLNGVMFSSKWLAEDMNCNKDETLKLRGLVEEAHKKTGLKEGSPGDWWVIILGDGDGMGKYVSGKKLGLYEDYLIENIIDTSNIESEAFEKLKQTKKRMGPATHIGLNRALLDFSNRLVPYLTQERYCGKVVYSGGDDVMAVLPLPDLPSYLRSLRAAWCAASDPENEFDSVGGYWTPNCALNGLEQRPYFTMGKNATMSIGIVIAHKSIPLPTVLENLWTAEKDKAKKIIGKDGLCFRIIYSSGNTLEALMKGNLLDGWWNFMAYYEQDLSSLFYRLAQELPSHTTITKSENLVRKASEIVLNQREQNLDLCLREDLLSWLNSWEKWAYESNELSNEEQEPLGTKIQDLANILRFSAFWNDKMLLHKKW